MFKITKTNIIVEDFTGDSYGIAFESDGRQLAAVEDISVRKTTVLQFISGLNENNIDPKDLLSEIEKYIDNPYYEG